MRPDQRTRLMSAAAVLGLVILSGAIALIINASTPANPILPIEGGNGNGSPGPAGNLVVQVLSNQNENDRFSSPARGLLGVADKTILVTEAINSSGATRTVLVTDSTGHASQSLAAGPYLLSLRDEALDIKIRVQITPGNETTVVLTVLGAAYPLVYSEEAAGGAQSSVYAEVSTAAPVANPGDPVILKVVGAPPGRGTLYNATLVSSQSPLGGIQWLELAVQGTVDPLGATSMVLTTWTYTDSISVHPIVLGVFAPANA